MLALDGPLDRGRGASHRPYERTVSARKQSSAEGVKETLLSGFVQFYQALDAEGAPVKLDLCEGPFYNFQGRIPDTNGHRFLSTPIRGGARHEYVWIQIRP